jgi:hypothetical protein
MLLFLLLEENVINHTKSGDTRMHTHTHPLANPQVPDAPWDSPLRLGLWLTAESITC